MQLVGTLLALAAVKAVMASRWPASKSIVDSGRELGHNSTVIGVSFPLEMGQN